MSAEAFEGALRAAGIRARVEARGGLAIVIAEPAAFAEPALRLRATSLAREHGFTHVAVEVSAEGARAPLPGD